jgi:ferredoxin/menaquinone-dependent protoporphyrinogen IX oxidase
MNAIKVLILYFSATGNTGKLVKVIKERFTELGTEVADRDITPYADRQKSINLEPYDAVVFGASIHSWRAPRVVREWLRTLDGQGKKCSMFFTYGGFGVHPTHYSTRKILQEQNFTVVSSADFPGKHTFNIGGWRAMPGRPDTSDFEVAKEYVDKTYNRFTGEDPGILEELPQPELTDDQLDQLESFRFNIVTKLPTRDGEECSMCMICEESCPTGAMNAESGRADPGKCIVCLACIANCPDDSLKVNDLSQSWAFKLELEKTDEESIKGQRSRIYL